MMRFLRGTSRLLAVPLLLLAVALVLIGTLQYRWLEQVRDAERKRMREELHEGAQRLTGEIGAEILDLFRAFLAPELDDVEPLLENWRRDASHPDLVAAVYVADRDGDTWTLRRLDEASNALADAAWPPALESMRPHLEQLGQRGPDREGWPDPLFGSIPALFIVQLPARREPAFVMNRPFRVILLQIDRDALRRMIETLAARNLPKISDVALLSDRDVLYRSSESWPDDKRDADLSLRFAPVHPPRPSPPFSVERRAFSPPLPFGGLKARRSTETDTDATWQLLVRQHGGLDAVIAAAHRRNLAVAFLVLAILAAAGVMLIVLLRRAERLRTQQAQFVASMSHELNTPLAVLRVASENLQDGIVLDPEKVSRYVRTIARETTHLSEMVNHVLELAGMSAGTPVASRELVDVGTIIDDAVAQSRWLPEGKSIDVEVEVEPDLPLVRGSAPTLTRAVQNLLANAMRHGGAGQWVGVRASARNGQVEIAVEDRGPGIDAADAAHLFEPFYRGRGSSTVRGTGLGLTIVKQIVTDHGGKVDVERRRGGGSAFIIRLPVGAEHV